MRCHAPSRNVFAGTCQCANMLQVTLWLSWLLFLVLPLESLREITLVQACEKKVNEMRDEMGQFWLYNIYDTCSIDQALPPATQRHKAFDEWCAQALRSILLARSHTF